MDPGARDRKRKGILRRLRRPAAFLCFGALLTWLVALAQSFLSDPRHGAVGQGEAWYPGQAWLSLQVWESRATTLVEAEWRCNARRNWGTEQVLGDPDTHSTGDLPTAWASATPDGQREWLDLRWGAPIDAAGVSVYQTYNPGAVERITASLGSGPEEVIWTRPLPPHPPPTSIVLKAPLHTSRRIDRVRVYIDSPSVPGWNEIDAVCIVDVQGKAHGADAAQASSTYADRLSAGALPEVPGWSRAERRPEEPADGSPRYVKRVEAAFGWPLRAWVATREIRAAGLAPVSGAGPGVMGAPGPLRAVPTRAVASGLMVNAVAYGAALVLLRAAVLGPFRPARRLMRMQRGHCPACGYDLRFNFAAGCSECGHLRDAGASRTILS